MRADIDCSQDEVSSPKFEYYNSQNALIAAIWTGKNSGPITPNSPIAAIKKIVCFPKEVEKCDELNLVEGPPFSGIYLGTIQEGQEITNVQLKLVQTDNNIAGSYYRETSCGTVHGTVDRKGDLLFDWTWSNASGRGRAVKDGDLLTASSGYGDDDQGGGHSRRPSGLPSTSSSRHGLTGVKLPAALGSAEPC